MTFTADSPLPLPLTRSPARPLRAKPYLHCAPLPDGVYFSGARAQFTLRGWDRLFQVADICVPLLEDGTSEDELVSALGSEQARPVVRRMVEGLREHGMLLEAARWTVPAPDDALRTRYAGPLAHLESAHPDPYAAFARVRAATVAVIGPDAAVRPALRGLTRAGIGRVVAADAAAGFGDADVVIRCVAPEQRAERTRWLDALDTDRPNPRTRPVELPVWLDDEVLVVGPAGDPRSGAALFDRALAWARSTQAGPVARPVADALAGALAAQLAFDVVAGIDDVGTAHVVHGAELRSDRVPVASDGPGPVSFTALDDAVESATVLTQRWTGLFDRSSREDQLPQMPLSLRELSLVERNMGPVTVWAPHQQAATLAAALEGLRRSRATTDRPDGTVSAAGLSERQWLLDGALRLLTDRAEESDLVAGDVSDPETRRLRKILDGLLPGRPHHVRISHVPGVAWQLSTVTDAATGAVLGRAWAPDLESAVRDSVSTAIARTQVPGADGAESPVAALCTNALLLADADALATLDAQVTAHARARHVRFDGQPLREDPVLGDLPFWHGPVRTCPIRPLAVEENDEH